VLPASFHVDLVLLKKATKAKAVELASENEFKDQFPECETGAMPPFGNLYDVDVFADESLAKDKEIAFNACSHRELIRLAWEDFEKLVEPRIIRFSTKRTAEAA
jgi:Ala-tRNA(Pro) deacylase